MIQSIQIENFRCFHRTQIEGFGRINLIGGLNNSGKTALLEAIYAAFGTLDDIDETLLKFRGEYSEKIQEGRWQNFFYQQDISKEIKLSIKEIKLSIKFSHFEEKVKSIFDYEEEEESSNFKEGHTILSSLYKYEQIVYGYGDGRDRQKRDEKSIRPEGIYPPKTTISYDSDLSHYGGDKDFISLNKGKEYKSITNTRVTNVKLLYTNKNGSSNKDLSYLPELYSQVVSKQGKEVILDALKKIDSSINNSELLLHNGQPLLYLGRAKEVMLPVNLFGDAISTMAEYALVILNNKDSIILIDEIENGIHYTNQKKVWEVLFKVAKENNVQIFATTHSREMIEAFSEVANENEENKAEGVYFEMYRSGRSGEIVGTRNDVDLLAYKILSNDNFRGEW